MRDPNSQECAFFGRKLGNINNHIEVNLGYVVICSDRDDEIYFDVIDNQHVAPEGMLKERVKITALHEGEPGHCFDIDLEDVLRFAAKYCRGIYDRVAKETEKHK